jgi:hypothetical protein
MTQMADVKKVKDAMTKRDLTTLLVKRIRDLRKLIDREDFTLTPARRGTPAGRWSANVAFGSVVAQDRNSNCTSGSNLTLESRMGFPSDLPNVVVGFQAAISRFVAEANDDPKPFTWLADPNKSIVAVRRGYQVLDLIH